MLNGKEIKNKRRAMGWSAETLADLLKVSKDNIYKWEKGHVPSNPEDYLKVEKWLKSGKIENVPEKSIVSDSEPHYGQALKDKDEIISLLKEKNLRLQNALEANLKTAEVVQASILAYLKAIVQEDAERKSAGDRKKFEKEMSVWGKRIASNLGLPVQTGIGETESK